MTVKFVREDRKVRLTSDMNKYALSFHTDENSKKREIKKAITMSNQNTIYMNMQKHHIFYHYQHQLKFLKTVREEL